MALGEELVTNGDFDTDSDWDKGTGWAIGDGVASLSDVPSDAYLSQDISIVADKSYFVVFEVKNHTKGSVLIRVGGGGGTIRSANGVYEEIIYARSTDTLVKFHGGFGPNALSVDNVSVKEAIGVTQGFVG